MSRQFPFSIKLLGNFYIVFAALTSFFVLSPMASDRFVDNSDGTVTDTQTGLMWAAQDNGSLVNWRAGRSYILEYKGGGHTDWRLPTLAELETLYDPEVKNKHGYHLTNSINLTAASCWAAETEDYKAARFNFTYGEVYWLRKSFSGPSRVLPVRNAK